MAGIPHAIDSVLQAVGRTPLVRLERLERPGGPRLYAKCEYLGPANSIFDRAAVGTFLAAERGGHLCDGRGIAMAGGTDAVISMAMVCSASGHPFTAVVPKSLNIERKKALVDYGAKLVTVEDEVGLLGAEEKALDLAKQQHLLFVELFCGDEVTKAYEQIGTEIVEALGAPPALTVAGLDLGAIPTGIARGVGGKVVAVEPEAARIGSAGTFGPHLLGGLASAQDPIALDRQLITEFEGVSDRDAWTMADRLSRETGILAGIASGAVLVAALRRAESMSGGEIVAVLPDSGERRFMLAALFQ